MTFQILHYDGEQIVRKTCLTSEQIKKYLWSMRAPHGTMITIADIQTQASVHGTRKTLINVLGTAEDMQRAFDV